MNEITITLTGQEAADYLQYKAEQMNKEKRTSEERNKYCLYCAKFDKLTCKNYPTYPQQRACPEYEESN